MPLTSYYNFGEVFPSPINSLDYHQHVYGLRHDSFDSKIDQSLEIPLTKPVIENHDSFQYSNSFYNNYNYNYNEFEESGETVNSSIADGAQDRLKIQDGVSKFIHFIIHEDDPQLSLDEVAQIMDDDFIPVDTTPNILGTAKSSPTSYTGKPYDATIKRSLKSNAKVLNKKIAKPAIYSPTGIMNVAKIDQMIRFSKDQKKLNKIKRKKSHLYRSYWERRANAGLCLPIDLMSTKELEEELDKDVSELIAHPLSSEVYDDLINITREDYGIML